MLTGLAVSIARVRVEVGEAGQLRPGPHQPRSLFQSILHKLKKFAKVTLSSRKSNQNKTRKAPANIIEVEAPRLEKIQNFRNCSLLSYFFGL